MSDAPDRINLDPEVYEDIGGYHAWDADTDIWDKFDQSEVIQYIRADLVDKMLREALEGMLRAAQREFARDWSAPESKPEA